MSDRRGALLVALALLVPVAALPAGWFTSAFRLESAILAVAAAGIAFSAARRLLEARPVIVPATRHAVAGAVFFLLPLASAAWSGNRLAALDVGIGRAALGVVFLFAFLMADRLRVRGIFAATSLASVAVALVALGPLGAASTLENPNFAATFQACALPAAAALLLAPRSAFERALGAAGSVASVLHLLVARSRGGWIAAAVALVVLAAGARRGRALLVLAFPLAVVLAVPALRERALSALDPAAPTNRVRLLVWGGTARLLADHPALGVGAGGFEREFAPYRPEEEARLDTPGARVDQPHDLFLQVLAETGPAGLVALAVLAGGVALSLVRRRLEPEDAALAAAFAAFLAHGLVEGVLDNPAAGLLFAISGGVLSARARAGVRSVALPGRPTGFVLALAAFLALSFHLSGTSADHHLARAYLDPVPVSRLERLKRAEGFAPWDGRVPRERGTVQIAMGRHDDSIAAWDRAISLDPNHEVSWDGLARARFGAGATEDALEAWRRALALAPFDARIRSNLGIALFDLGRTGEAASELVTAFEAERSPDATDALRVAVAFAASGSKGRALAWLRRAAEMGVPEDALRDSVFDPIRSEEAFLEIEALTRMGRAKENHQGDRR